MFIFVVSMIIKVHNHRVQVGTFVWLHVHASTQAAAGTSRLAHFQAESYSVQSASSWVSAVRDTAKCALRAASMHILFQNMLRIPALDYTTSLWAWGSSWILLCSCVCGSWVFEVGTTNIKRFGFNGWNFLPVNFVFWHQMLRFPTVQVGWYLVTLFDISVGTKKQRYPLQELHRHLSAISDPGCVPFASLVIKPWTVMIPQYRFD